MRVGRSPHKRSEEEGLTRQERPDNGFLIRIGRSDKFESKEVGILDGEVSSSTNKLVKKILMKRPTVIENSLEPILTRNLRADKGFLIRVGKADPSFLPNVERTLGAGLTHVKRQKTGSKAYFLTRVGRAGEPTKRKSYFTRIGSLFRSPSPL